ncbi:GxxExxY protein [Planctomycetales bacterium ZRK34]|nr:GxxExxY protein [Planctomycetales bacterium ZRK34]
MNENDAASILVDIGYNIHRKLGPGLLESVYEQIMEYELRQRGLAVRRQVSVPVRWKSVTMETAFRADLIVEECLLVELKSTMEIAPVYMKQLLTYLRLTHLRLGLLINFGMELYRDGVRRVVNGLPDSP